MKMPLEDKYHRKILRKKDSTFLAELPLDDVLKVLLVVEVTKLVS